MVPLTLTSRLARRLRSARGAELIEFALVLPVLLCILGGILDMGLAFNNYVAVTNAAREGARVAAIPGWVEDDVKNRVNPVPGSDKYRATGVRCLNSSGRFAIVWLIADPRPVNVSP